MSGGEITILPPVTGGLPDIPGQGPDVSGVADDIGLIRLWLTDQRSMHTVRFYDRVAAQLLRTLPHGLRGATVADVARFEAGLGHMKANSKHATMSVVRSLFSFAARTGYVGRSVAHVRKNRRPPFLASRYLTEEEVWAIIDHAATERDKVLLRFLYSTAVRVSELCGLTWADIRTRPSAQDAQFIGKGERPRTVSIPTWVGLMRPEGAGSEDAVFTTAGPNDEHPWKPMHDTTVRKIMREAALLAGIRKKVSPHWFRHAAISHAQDNGVSPVDVMGWVGHGSLETTSRYSHPKANSAPGEKLGRKDRK